MSARESQADPVVRFEGAILIALVLALAAGAASLLLYRLVTREVPRTAVERQLMTDEVAVREHPDDIENWARVALSYAHAERWDDAADAIEKGRAVDDAAILDLTEADILRMKGDAAAVDAYDRAITSARAENERQVAELLKKKAVDVPPPDVLLIEAMRGRALALHSAGRTEEAVEQASEALALDPTDAGLRTALGDMYRELGRAAEAEEQYRAALRYVPDLTAALEGLARLGKEP